MCYSYLDTWKERQRKQIENRVYIFMNQFLERYARDLLPARCTLGNLGKVLDVACGCGGWVCNAARAYPNSEVTGIDKDAEHIIYAREYATLAGLTNAHFIVGNMYTLSQLTEPYDLIHARLLCPAVAPGTWYNLLKELWQHCKQGGQIRWTESITPVTPGRACTRWCHLFGQALGLSNSAGDIINSMPAMLKDVGFCNIQQSMTTIRLQHGNEAYDTLVHTLWRASPLLQTFFVQAGITTADHFTHITDEMLTELLDPGFTCNWSLRTVTGSRP